MAILEPFFSCVFLIMLRLKTSLCSRAFTWGSTEPWLCYQCMTSEVVERDVLYKSLRLFNLEHQKRAGCPLWIP